MLAAGLVAAHHTVHLDPGPLLVPLLRVTHPSGRGRLVLLRVPGVSFPHPISVPIGISPAAGHHGHNRARDNASHTESRRWPKGLSGSEHHVWKPSARRRAAPAAGGSSAGGQPGGGSTAPLLCPGWRNRTDRLRGR
ncbi:hypothetical protein GDO78_022473 [Eleutherodactylus coqui]|uniref:Uncharacterized protein n=1 Tax=Eleutherodactylus coqui TaxID=57060 RepID=A0A8J6B2L1_ELECQ|nr:hypothetical protein GDO78_022473 [Eleutherodactylus coqui]